jgi:hypothetical protein
MKISKEECWWYIELFKKIETHKKAIEQAMEVRKIARNADEERLPKKHFDKVETDMPEPKKGVAYYVWRDEVMPAIETFYSTHHEILKDLERLPPKDDAQEQELAEGFKHYGKGIIEVINKFMGPFKDLKYATTIPNWWKAVKNYFAHGKHAAAVMQAIKSHKYMRNKTIKVNGIQCPHNCGYYVTVPDEMAMPAGVDYIVNPYSMKPQITLLMEHLIEAHKFTIPKEETVKETIIRMLPEFKIGIFKTIIQVALERNFTREQTGDQINELLELALAYTQAVPAFAALCNWRVDVHDPRVATRRIDAHEPLSYWA